MSANDHGSASTYTNHACRCPECREAYRVYAPAKAARERYRRRLGMSPRKPARPLEAIHGTRYAYVRRECRCEACTAAAAEYMRQRRARGAA